MHKFLSVACWGILLPNHAASWQYSQLKEHMTQQLPDVVSPEKYYHRDSTASMDANFSCLHLAAGSRNCRSGNIVKLLTVPFLRIVSIQYK